MSDDPEEAAVRRTTDEKRLLPGEEPATAQLSDAAHWIFVYSELGDTKRKLIANLKEMMERQSQDARDELEKSDVRVLQLQADRFERRLSFWLRRHAELEKRAPG